MSGAFRKPTARETLMHNCRALAHRLGVNYQRAVAELAEQKGTLVQGLTEADYQGLFNALIRRSDEVTS